MTLNNSFANSQADPSTGKFFPRVQPLKDLEDAITLRRVNPNAVIAHLEDKIAVHAGSANVDFRGTVIGKFNRVSYQVLE